MHKRIQVALAIGVAAALPHLYGFFGTRSWLQLLGRPKTDADILISLVPMAITFFAIACVAAWTTLQLRRAEPKNVYVPFVVALVVFFIETWFTPLFVFFLDDAKVGMVWSLEASATLLIVLSLILKVVCAVLLSVYFSPVRLHEATK